MTMLMEAAESTGLEQELTRRIQDQTGRRVRELDVQVLPDVVVLNGRTTSWYVKQLAQHIVFGMALHRSVRNAITVGRAG